MQPGAGESPARCSAAELTPLFHTHINPYGVFELDLESPSFLISGLTAGIAEENLAPLDFRKMATSDNPVLC